MKILGVLQARFSSSRLPGKVLSPLAGQPMLLRQIQRVRRANLLHEIVVATSTLAEDDPIADLCDANRIACFRGSLSNVLDRVTQTARAHSADWVVRLTGDCPLIDPDVIDAVIAQAVGNPCDYASNAICPTFPDGLDVEVLTMEALETAWREATLLSEREHVTPFIHKQPSRFRILHYKHDKDLSTMRWTVDEPEDMEFVRAIFDRLHTQNPDFGMSDVLDLLAREPHLSLLNGRFSRNEGYAKSLELDKNAEEF
jgi:spore coat polysaccharide biosynthesis protein SpsF